MKHLCANVGKPVKVRRRHVRDRWPGPGRGGRVGVVKFEIQTLRSFSKHRNLWSRIFFLDICWIRTLASKLLLTMFWHLLDSGHFWPLNVCWRIIMCHLFAEAWILKRALQAVVYKVPWTFAKTECLPFSVFQIRTMLDRRQWLAGANFQRLGSDQKWTRS